MRKGPFYKFITFILSLGWATTLEAGVGERQNNPPVFDPSPECYVSEPDTNRPQLSSGVNHVVDSGVLEKWVQTGGSLPGDTFTTCWVSERHPLRVLVFATDPEGEKVFLSVLNPPPLALFSDSGNGKATFVWTPEFVGPWSSTESPFEFNFLASDGKLSSQLKVVINVINLNQNPELILPESSEVSVGNQLVFQVRGQDKDSDEVTVQPVNLPPKANFNPVSGIFSWTPELADTGLWIISFQGVDPWGGECLRGTRINVIPPATYSLSVEVKESLLGRVVEVPINLSNSAPVAGMELQVEFDPTLFTFVGLSRQGCRTENWEYFTYKQKSRGPTQVIRMVGIADFPNQIPTPPLPPGWGALVYLGFRLSADPYLNGLLLPLEFYSADFTDNTLSTPRGRFIPQEMIDYMDGGVWLNPENTRVGDINQNGIAFEVADAVKLANYIMGRTTLSPQELINSDVNQDGRMGMLSDLVFLIRRIMEKGTAPSDDIMTQGELAVVKILDEPPSSSHSPSTTWIRLESETAIGGAMMIFKGENLKIQDLKLSPSAQNLDLYTSAMENEYRVLVVSSEAKPLPRNDSPLLSFEGEGWDSIQIFLSDHAGELMKVEQQYERGFLPIKYALYQNYPNPFNPETSIKYFVGGDGAVHVSLKIYNVVGQLVKSLVDEDKLPGEYNQAWNGKNENNEEVASGVYFYKLKISDYVETRRMVLLR